MNIILTDISNLAPFVIPVVPTNYTIRIDGDNSEEDTLNGKINVMKNAKLRHISWSSIFPVHSKVSIHSLSIPNGWAYVSFIEFMRAVKLPIRVITTNSDKIPTFTILATIENFTYSVDKVGDIQYSIELKETSEKIYDFILRDARYLVTAGKYVVGLFKKAERTENLKKAGLLIKKLWKQEYR